MWSHKLSLPLGTVGDKGQASLSMDLDSPVPLCSVCGLSASGGVALGAGLLHKAEGLQELIDVDAAILVEVDASGEVTDVVIGDVDVHVGAEELPCLSELIQGDESLQGGEASEP